MSHFFDVYGPFDVGKNETGWTATGLRKLLDDWDEGLASAIGCYVFCIKRGSKLVPWYVGKTENVDGFMGEVFTSHKRKIYRDICDEHSGTPVMFLLPLMTSTSRFSRGKSWSSVILWLEDTLMGMAYSRNPEISNVRGMSFRRNVTVLGLLGDRSPGRPHAEVTAIRNAFFGGRN